MSQPDLSTVRERFLCDHELIGDVRESISLSWRRSKALDIAVERYELPFVREPDLDSPLVEAARPIMRRLADGLADDPISVILTSDDGVVLSRATATNTLTNDLDQVNLAPGFSYSEEYVGTNGIGTTLETRKPTLVVGAEHYRQSLVNLACAGVPIFNPVTGTLAGALDLTGWVEQGGGLMMTLAMSAAKQIEDRLVELSGVNHAALLNAYLASCRRHPGRMILAIGDDIVMTNELMRRSIDSIDQAALLEHAADSLRGASRSLPGASQSIVEVMPSGRTMRLSRLEGNHLDHPMALFSVHVVDDGSAGVSAPALESGALPGLAGRSSSWRLACAELRRSLQSGEWVAAAGENGSGRCAALKAAAEQRRSGYVRTFGPMDLQGEAGLSELEAELDRDGFSVIVREIDALTPATLEALSVLLSDHIDDGWVGVTVSNNSVDTTIDAMILPLFARTVTIPALRFRIEDLAEIVPLMLRQLTRSDDLHLSAAAMRQLSKYGWPGNVGQLRRVLTSLVQRQRSGVVEVEGLPAVCRTFGRHTLSQIEALERDAIVRVLTENDFNKKAAADALGISRATIYRKIKQFGIVT
ncbi:GAF domain-containing protein [Gordonia sp. TBRC 11910]|uniref:GAF domain-containing protein n=1 Tax=Gordonia asplenii TaxID=2725283 RepID=A0A848KTT5_9ACTN|nr:helix-turn-helix domain-containing protein [Gordonia asplenii]NMO01407.1 GAF domain-containing protein [Gordonia asplenii]